jgi:hypothetical protein
MPKAKSRKVSLRYPATRRDDTRRLMQELKNSPIYVKNFVHRPSHTRRAPNNLSLLLTKELNKSPIYVKNFLHRPSRTRKTFNKMKKKLTKPLTNKPLGIKI